MPKYLACYDYGQGGIWIYIEAESPSQISEAYRDLIVFETPPTWWTPEMESSTRAHLGPIWENWLEKQRR